MEREITVKYSSEIIKFAVWKFWTRSIGLNGFATFIALCLAFLVILAIGDWSWLLGFMGAGVLFCTSGLIASYFICLNRSMDKFKQMETPVAQFHFTDNVIAVKSDMGKAEIPWKMIEKIWMYPSVWLVFVEKQSYITLPTANIDEELQQFIAHKTNETGGNNK